MSKVIVVGGGAGGMMAAIAASECGHQVTLIEQNEKLGKKIYITGKGRCNLTNASDMEQIFSNIVSNPKFLYSALYGFDNQACMDFFEKHGLKIKTERGNRVFPVSDHASDVIKTLEKCLKENQVEIRLRTRIKELILEPVAADESQDASQRKEKISFQSMIKGVVDSHGKRYMADAVIMATGGVSYETTGATGEGIRISQGCGHRVVDLEPSLVPLVTREDWCKDLMGLALKNVTVTIKNGKKTVYEDFGEMLFTHFGVSGPLILSASSRVNSLLKKQPLQMYIDLKPALGMEQLEKRLMREFEQNHQKQFKNALNGLFPTRLIPVMIKQSGIHPDKKVCEITKAERNSFAGVIKALPLTIVKTGDFNEAIITKGGVSVKDINPSTMESKLVKGLYFAGEMIDVDALTGGYNLQIAWSTGHLAGSSI